MLPRNDNFVSMIESMLYSLLLVDGLVQERRNSSALAIELPLFSTELSMYMFVMKY